MKRAREDNKDAIYFPGDLNIKTLNCRQLYMYIESIVTEQSCGSVSHILFGIPHLPGSIYMPVHF